jgi:choline dehydrogenase
MDWTYQTQPQNMLNSRQVRWPSGKVVGGSSAANGMYLVRPSAIELDVWQGLINTLDGHDAWTSDSVFAAMRKVRPRLVPNHIGDTSARCSLLTARLLLQSETFTPPRDDIRDLAHIEYNATSHGTSGPLHATYSAYMPPMYGSWMATLAAQGIAPAPDPYNGQASGAFISNLAINPTNWTRSYSRSAYIDPYYRPNLHILPDAQVSKVVLEGTTAVGVQYGSDLKTVKASQEVILSAGALGSPAILLRSGIGPKDVLDAAGVTTAISLPGVGQHLQDHLVRQALSLTHARTH